MFDSSISLIIGYIVLQDISALYLPFRGLAFDFTNYTLWITIELAAIYSSRMHGGDQCNMMKWLELLLIMIINLSYECAS
jgi:hypothetical protein